MGITRKAILIGAPSVKPELPGVKVDVDHIKSFLTSNKGGAWKESEITTLIDPSPSVVKTHLKLAEDSDYVFVTCSGHGEHRVGKGIDETVMHLNESDVISINEVNPKNKRHLVIVDVCRNIVEIKREHAFAVAKATMESMSESHINYRKVFDDAIMATSEGRIVAYSCDLNQSAGDDGNGGVFTQALLGATLKHKPFGSEAYGVLDIKAAFDTASEDTYRRNAPQKPVFNAGRRREFFHLLSLNQNEYRLRQRKMGCLGY